MGKGRTVRLQGRELRLREGDGGLDVAGIDLHAEVAAATLSRQTPGWLELKAGGHDFRVRQLGRRLEVEGVDLQAERAGALLAGEVEPWLLVLTVLERLIGEGQSLEHLLTLAQTAAPRRGAGQFQSTLWVANRHTRRVAMLGQEILDRSLAHQELAPEAMEWVSRNGFISERVGLVANKACPDDIRVRVLGDPKVVREMVCEGFYHEVLEAAGRAGALRVLAKDESSLIRALVARWTGERDLLLELSFDPKARVRSACVENQMADRRLLLDLACDRDYRVGRDARRRLGLGDCLVASLAVLMGRRRRRLQPA